MGILDDAFAGSDGLANVLISSLGGTALFETVLVEEYREDTDHTHREYSRQVLPFVIEQEAVSSTAVTGGGNGGLIGSETLYVGIVPAANIDVPPKPLKTIIHDRRVRYQVVKVEPSYVGNTPVIYRMTLRRL